MDCPFGCKLDNGESSVTKYPKYQFSCQVCNAQWSFSAPPKGNINKDSEGNFIIKTRLGPYKVIIIGEGAGLFTQQYCKTFEENKIEVIGMNPGSISIDVDASKIHFHFHELSKSERFQNLRTAYYRGAAVIILTYKQSSPDSLVNLESYFQEFLKNNGKTQEEIKKDRMVLLGVRESEKHETATSIEAQQIAKKLKISYKEINLEDEREVKTFLETLAGSFLK